MFSISFTEDALEDLRFLEKGVQSLIFKSVEEQLQHEPLKETRNRKTLRPNDLSSWEVRVGEYRVFYDVDEANLEVTVKAVGWKEHNRLFIRGKEHKL